MAKPNVNDFYTVDLINTLTVIPTEAEDSVLGTCGEVAFLIHTARAIQSSTSVLSQRGGRLPWSPLWWKLRMMTVIMQDKPTSPIVHAKYCSMGGNTEKIRYAAGRDITERYVMMKGETLQNGTL